MDSIEKKILAILWQSQCVFCGSVVMASRVASMSVENSEGTGPAACSPSNRLADMGHDPSLIVGTLSLHN
jgi:hypothetical protein